ncbi:phosphoribosylamine--glycine ligase [Limosilactobacillus sp.]|jgi:phosphoribosylamine--glycine ligase|uniref:phosphoribosylamine--glycine ligase n=1 Tax=Limosilactobacillus sp. TaxID=2773925 RepID=UPI0025C6AEA3|nr:phosphoribosylamine--glycine ligase [Limosilactobacillus sp.]MCH3921827.1 phosphoribosylamine--glycine ligase [Limosilactobacillus sp.]MCH3928598.1 phosphoribosylamine--glycine ligase [Limosilactobacillus sp.]
MTEQVNVLVVGEGGREFAIAHKLQQSPKVKQVYCAPGNVGMKTVGVVPVAIPETDFAGLIRFAKEHQVAWTFVGPEDCLVDGIVDDFRAAGLKAFGPSARAAQLEGSKDYALNFMNNYGVPTARHASYRDQTAAIRDVDQFGFPVVIKENGLAGGKGVVIAPDRDTAVQTIKEMFGQGQARLVLEECLQGQEYSMFVLLSNDHYRILPMAQDHKRAYDGDKGPNTGGMGAYSPLPQLSTADYQRMVDEVVTPTVNGLVAGDYDYHGILYIGLILTADGPKVIEYNVRLGDPETQVILPRLATDLFDLVDAALNDQPLPEVKEDPAACLGVVLASKGYPTKPVHGQSLGEFPQEDGIEIAYANVAGDLGDLRGNGGRLLMVLAKDASLKQAHDRVYRYLDGLDEPECFYRHDIGAKAGL